MLSSPFSHHPRHESQTLKRVKDQDKEGDVTQRHSSRGSQE